MGSSLLPTNGGGMFERREDRTVARQIGGIQRSQSVGLARIEAEAELAAAVAHAVGFVGQQGMQAVAMVSQLEAQLGQACPMAVTRLQGIADMTALSVAQVVADSARKIGR